MRFIGDAVLVVVAVVDAALLNYSDQRTVPLFPTLQLFTHSSNPEDTGETTELKHTRRSFMVTSSWNQRSLHDLQRYDFARWLHGYHETVICSM